MSTFRPHGMMTALVTPFRSDGSLNLDEMPHIIEYQVDAGVAGIVVTAGSGEYVTLRSDERVEVVRQAAAILQGRVPLIAGVLAPDTGSAIDAAQAAQDAGADALLLLTPFYLTPSIGGIVAHFQKVAEAVTIPIILYNIPARTNINLDVPTLVQLADLPGVVGIKECDRDMGRVAVKIMHLGSRLSFLSGDDDLCIPLWSIGGSGAIMSSTNMTAPWAVECFAASQAGDWDTARELFYSRLLPFMMLYRGADHPGQLKQALGLAGFQVGSGRPPLQPVDTERLAHLERGLRELDLIDQGRSFAVNAASGTAV